MYRNNEELVAGDHGSHSFVLNHGALGDAICSLPAVAHARMNRHPTVHMRLYCPTHQMELFTHLLKPYGEIEVLDIRTFPGKAADRKAMNFGPLSHNAPFYDTHTRNATHMVDFAFRFLLDKDPGNMHERSYVTRAPLGPRTITEPYVVFPTGYTSENKAFRMSVMAPVMRWCLDNGMRPVMVGTKTPYTSMRGPDGKSIPLAVMTEAHLLPGDLVLDVLDLRDKTTLMQARDVCGHAEAVAGVDGGTIHLAGTTDVPIVYAMTTTHPRHRMIARNGDPWHKIRYVAPRDLECAGCQSNWVLTYFDFSKCAYGDNLCTYKLHEDDFIAGLKDLTGL